MVRRRQDSDEEGIALELTNGSAAGLVHDSTKSIDTQLTERDLCNRTLQEVSSLPRNLEFVPRAGGGTRRALLNKTIADIKFEAQAKR